MPKKVANLHAYSHGQTESLMKDAVLCKLKKAVKRMS